MEVCNVGSQIDFSSFLFFLRKIYSNIHYFLNKNHLLIQVTIFFLLIVIQQKKNEKKILIHCLVGRSNI